MMVPLLPVGGPLPGEMDDFSIIRPEKHLWVSVWPMCFYVQLFGLLISSDVVNINETE